MTDDDLTRFTDSALAQHRDLVSFDQVEIYLSTESWSIRNVNHAVFIDVDVRYQPMLLGFVGKQHFEILTIGNCHDQMQIGEIVK